MKEEMLERLEKLAILMTRPFCYNCYESAPTGRCKRCGSDDLMREMPGVGVEYGTDWIIKEILEEVGTVDTDERFEESLRECYEETTKIGWLNYDTVSAIWYEPPRARLDQWLTF